MLCWLCFVVEVVLVMADGCVLRVVVGCFVVFVVCYLLVNACCGCCLLLAACGCLLLCLLFVVCCDSLVG